MKKTHMEMTVAARTYEEATIGTANESVGFCVGQPSKHYSNGASYADGIQERLRILNATENACVISIECESLS
jgi:hypothetical protein